MKRTTPANLQERELEAALEEGCNPVRGASLDSIPENTSGVREAPETWPE
jgi:hypothetical protein